MHYIFDLDGTLVNSMNSWEDVSKKFLKKYEKEYDKDFFYSLLAHSMEEGAKLIKERYELEISPQTIQDEISKELVYYYKNHIKLKEHVLKKLEQIHKKGHKLYIATASNYNIATMVLENNNCLKYFEFIESCFENGFSKSDIAFFENLLKKIDADKKDILYFDDSIIALETAKKAGLFVIGVKDKTNIFQTKKIKAIANDYIEDFSQIKVN